MSDFRRARKSLRSSGLTRKDARKKVRDAKKQYKGAGQAKAMDELVRDSIEERKLPPAMKEYNRKVTSELKALAGAIQNDSDFEDLDVPEVAFDATEGIAREIVAYMIANDPLISKSTADQLSMSVMGAEVEDLYPLMLEYKSKRGDIWEHIKAAGIPILGGGVLAYLDNTTNPTESPLLRLQAILSLVAGAIFGRGAETWVAAGILPLLKVLRNSLNVTQRVNWRIDSAVWTPPVAAGVGTLVVTGECAPELFTDQDAQIDLNAVVFGGFKARIASTVKTNLAKVKGGVFVITATYLGGAGEAGALIETSRNIVGQGGLSGYIKITVAPGNELKSTSHQTFFFEVASPTP